MKRIGWIMTLLLIVCSFSMELSAQESLDALVKKCEAMTTEDIDINVAREKDPKTKELVREIINITIRKNSKLANEFLTVFRKEKDNANVTHSSENRRQGHTNSLTFKYENDTHSFSYSYSSTGNNDLVRINVAKVPKGEKLSTVQVFPAIPVRSTAAPAQSLREAVALLDSASRMVRIELGNPVITTRSNRSE